MYWDRVMQSLVIHPVKTERERRLVHDIRTEVFVEEQQVSPEEEFDGYDDEAIHFIALLQKTAVGCARIRVDSCVKLERIAVRKLYRGRGFGTKLTHYLIEYARRFDVSEICLHAQLQVRGFYKKCGFQERGCIFVEAGIKHITMCQHNTVH